MSKRQYYRLEGFIIGVFMMMVFYATATHFYEKSHTEPEVGQDYVYVMCDVVEDNCGSLTCKMQDGSLHTYFAIDTPIGVREVTFKTDNLEDFTAYEIVALR